MQTTLTRRRRLDSLRAAFVSRFKAFVGHPGFPCVGAKSALNRSRMEFGMFDGLAGIADADALCDQLGAFSRQYPRGGAEPVSFVAMFRQGVANEDEFHDKLWHHLQAMHDIDAANHAWDDAVSADPADKAFSFSIGARAFFVVGLHPSASRLARRAPFPCLVFNFHDQFEALRRNGRYGTLQDAIRRRDVALQGSINPTLARFGEGSEAAQFSGHPQGLTKGCPFAARAGVR